jgi:pilus assembly protein FimV
MFLPGDDWPGRFRLLSEIRMILPRKETPRDKASFAWVMAAPGKPPGHVSATGRAPDHAICDGQGQFSAIFRASRDKFIYNGVLSRASHIKMTEAPQHSAWRKLQPPRLAGSLLVSFMVIFFSTSSEAAILGDVVAVSAVGQPLRTEIRSPGSALGVASQCLRFPTAVDHDGIPSVRDVRATIVEPGANARIIITTQTAVMEPIVRLTIENICESRLRREYVLLLSEPVPATPATTTATPVVQTTRARAPRPASGAAAPAAGSMRWVTAAGESANSLAEALYPNDEGARRAFVAGVLGGNPDLFPDGSGAATPLPPGTELQIPNLARVAAASSRPTPAQRPAASPAPAARPALRLRPPRVQNARVPIGSWSKAKRMALRSALPCPTLASATNCWRGRSG